MDLIQMQLPIILGLLFAAAQKGSGQVTEAPGATVTYNPGEDCLPYDDSVVPDCTLYVDPVLKQPYYKEHSTNCSRFWECGPNYETCLFECAHCGDESNQQCHYHEDNHYMPALAFDVSKQFPDGPVCNWPSDTTLRCHTECLATDECCWNPDCTKCPGGYCNLDFTCSYPDDCISCTSDSDCNDSDWCPGGTCNNDGSCSYPDDCCKSDSDCDHFDGMCNVPAPHTPDNCAFCDDNAKCAPGCANLGSDSTNCPSTHPNCNGSHECECPPNAECCDDSACNKCPGGTCNSDLTCSYPPDCCVLDSDCDNFDGVCNVPELPTPDNCAYCDNQHCIGGCANLGDDSMNCPSTHPNCNSHVCKPPADECQTDPECNEYYGICEPGVAIADQTHCMYCDTEGANNVCKPGCKYNSGDSLIPKCHEDKPKCNPATHGCQANSGSKLLTSMVFKSKGCDGCDKEGVNMTLTGSDSLATPPTCKTVDLDHPNQDDFSQTSTFNATTEEQYIGWDECYEAGLDGSVSAALVTWTGSGTWSPVHICFDWDDDNSYVTICTFEPGTTVTPGEEKSLGCALDKTTVDCFN